MCYGLKITVLCQYLVRRHAGLPPCVPPLFESGGQCVETCLDFHYGQVNSTGYGHCEPCEWVYTALIEWSHYEISMKVKVQHTLLRYMHDLPMYGAPSVSTEPEC